MLELERSCVGWIAFHPPPRDPGLSHAGHQLRPESQEKSRRKLDLESIGQEPGGLGSALTHASFSTGHPTLCALTSSPGNGILPGSDILTWCG